MYFGFYLKIVAVLLGAVAVYFAVRYRKEILTFLEQVIAELKKVNWTSRQDLINATLIVIASAICLGFFITFTDLIVSRGLNVILR